MVRSVESSVTYVPPHLRKPPAEIAAEDGIQFRKGKAGMDVAHTIKNGDTEGSAGRDMAVTIPLIEKGIGQGVGQPVNEGPIASSGFHPDEKSAVLQPIKVPNSVANLRAYKPPAQIGTLLKVAA